MKKLAFAAMAAIILVSAFVGIKTWTVNADLTNRMYFNPTEKVYDPPYGGTDLSFLYELKINTTMVNVSEWEAVLVWNPKVIRCLGVVWGTYMSGTPARNVLTNITNIYASGTGISLSQYYANQTLGTTGAGTLAYLNLTFVLPGATSLTFLEAAVWDDALNALALDGQTGFVKSNLPHPEFWWWTYDDNTVNTTVTQHYGNGTLGNVSAINHGSNPLPQSNIGDGNRKVPYGTTVYFTANMSYDVTNMEWNGSVYKLNASGPGINALYWQYGDGKSDLYSVALGNFSWLSSHVYTAYLYPGYTVNLTAYDASGAYWSSTWRYGGIRNDDVVPMWRDVGLVSIWPSLVPFDVWDNGTGTDWYVPWWFDTTDFYIPQTNDPYWNYQMSNDWCDSYGEPHGTTVKQAWVDIGDTGGDEGPGINICVTANNYGSVREKTRINLYAAAVTFKLTGSGPTTYAPLQVIDLEKIASWSYNFAAGTYLSGMISPAGSGWSLVTNWMPQKNAAYVLFATVETLDSNTITDKDLTNNLYQLPKLVSNIAVGNFTNGGLTYNGLVDPVKTYWNYMCDIRGLGSVSATDLAPMNQWLNPASNKWNTGVIPKSTP